MTACSTCSQTGLCKFGRGFGARQLIPKSLTSVGNLFATNGTHYRHEGKTSQYREEQLDHNYNSETCKSVSVSVSVSVIAI